MAISEKKPAYKVTAGAQYICFAATTAVNGWDGTFEEDVIKLPTVVNIKRSNSIADQTIYASGSVYDRNTNINSIGIEEENVAFPDELIAKMSGDTYQNGIIVSGGKRKRPFFAYGYAETKSDGSKVFHWFPKCKLTENSDDIATSTENSTEQNDTLNIVAFPYNDSADIEVKMSTADEKNKGITEEKFFAAPAKSAADVTKLATS